MYANYLYQLWYQKLRDTLHQTGSYKIYLNQNMYCRCLSRSTLRLAINILYVPKISLGIYFIVSNYLTIFKQRLPSQNNGEEMTKIELVSKCYIYQHTFHGLVEVTRI